MTEPRKNNAWQVIVCIGLVAAAAMQPWVSFTVALGWLCVTMGVTALTGAVLRSRGYRGLQAMWPPGVTGNALEGVGQISMGLLFIESDAGGPLLLILGAGTMLFPVSLFIHRRERVRANASQAASTDAASPRR